MVTIWQIKLKKEITNVTIQVFQSLEYLTFHQLKIKLKLDLPKGTSMFCQAIAISDKMQQRLFCHRYWIQLKVCAYVVEQEFSNAI